MTDKYKRVRDALEAGPMLALSPEQVLEAARVMRRLRISLNDDYSEMLDRLVEFGEDAAYIAACDPDTIQSLLEERDAAMALLRECQIILREECGERIDYVELNAFIKGNASARDVLAALGYTAGDSP